MPIYEYVCAVCGHRADILHGVHDPGPNFCPECGSEGSMRKAFAPPTIHFKGTGWAKKERRSSAAAASGGSSQGEGSAAKSSGSSDTSAAKDDKSSASGSTGSGSSGDGD
jgi:putative FmdB family regulatory protein